MQYTLDISQFISIHAPAKGATVSPSCCQLFSCISIHAPAKGATSELINSDLVPSYFNPRTREGCDFFVCYFVVFVSLFQSTHPRRVRRGGVLVWEMPSCISIHAPAKGATLQEPQTNQELQISIHAPAKGATVFFSHYLLLKNTANHFLKSFVSFFLVFL